MSMKIIQTLFPTFQMCSYGDEGERKHLKYELYYPIDIVRTKSKAKAWIDLTNVYVSTWNLLVLGL